MQLRIWCGVYTGSKISAVTGRKDNANKARASIDLKSFFDEIPHNLILKLIRRKIADEQMLTLVARALKAGVIVDGRFEKTD